MRLLQSLGKEVIAIDCKLRGNCLNCGLVTVDRFTPPIATLIDEESKIPYVVVLPTELSGQPLMTSLPDVKLPIQS